ncbi:MAG TPA: hypothetical protein VH186_17710 [Chloroflexia bacterium]|nr:hypothetical protein [Chloroflexia bacterium]
MKQQKSGNNPLDLTYRILLPVSLLLLVIGFAGPWYYGVLGKSNDWGWQPVWGLLLSLIAVNLFGLLSLTSCFIYVELYYRLGRPPLLALLKWIAAFAGLVVAVPLVVWTIWDLTERSATPHQAEGTLGWGVWVSLVGLILQVIALRARIVQVKRGT